jgi:PhnB protein
MSENVKIVQEGYHSVNPYLVVRNADKAIEFYKKAFGAEERFRMHGPDGKTIMHAELKIGDSMLTEESPDMKALSSESIGRSPISLYVYVYVKDVDDVFNQAISEGATVLHPVKDQLYGDRFGYLKDPFGHVVNSNSQKRSISK